MRKLEGRRFCHFSSVVEVVDMLHSVHNWHRRKYAGGSSWMCGIML